jgi:uncharacterized protein (TIGR02271 family)
MPLHKIADFDPNYQQTFDGDDIKGLEVYTDEEQKVGTVTDVLLDNEGQFRYLAIEYRFDSTGKQVLIPIGLTRIDYNRRRVYINELSYAQLEKLPEYSDRYPVDYDYEEQVRSIYRPTDASNTGYNRDTYDYQQDATLYDLNEQNHLTFKLYEEKLITNKRRVKVGEVAIGKHIETEIQRVEMPLNKERVAIERVPADSTLVVDPDVITFADGEVARIELYEETPEIRKEAFVREEVRVKKVVERDTVESTETVRRQELDVTIDGQLNVDGVNQIGDRD